MPQLHDPPADPSAAARFISQHGEPIECGNPSKTHGVAFGAIAARLSAPAARRTDCADSRAPRLVAIEVGDGTTVAADVVPAASPSPRGTIIFVHGFGGNRAENGLFRTLARGAAAAGFNSVAYDWRGIGESDGRFADTTMDDHVADFDAVKAWTSRRFGEAPVYAVGFSLGAAVIGLALQQGVDLRAVAYLSPAVRPRRSMWPRYGHESILRELARNGVVRKPGSTLLLGPAMLNALRDVDLGPNAFDLDVPLLVCHGTGDARIDCAHTQELVVARGSDADFGYLQVEDASHSFRPGEDHWGLLANAVTSWFCGARSGHSALESEPLRRHSTTI